MDLKVGWTGHQCMTIFGRREVVSALFDAVFKLHAGKRGSDVDA